MLGGGSGRVPSGGVGGLGGPVLTVRVVVPGRKSDSDGSVICDLDAPVDEVVKALRKSMAVIKSARFAAGGAKGASPLIKSLLVLIKARGGEDAAVPALLDTLSHTLRVRESSPPGNDSIHTDETIALLTPPALFAALASLCTLRSNPPKQIFRRRFSLHGSCMAKMPA